MCFIFFFFFSSRRRHTSSTRDWSSDVCSSDLGGLLARPVVAGFRTRAWSTRRLSELLAQLGYLPLSWTPLGGGAGRPTGGGQPATASAAGPGLAAQIAAAYSPPPGTFRWHHGYPASLHRQWHPG